MKAKNRKRFAIGILIISALCLIASNAFAQSAQDYFNKAKELLAQMKYDQALAEVNKAIQSDPSAAEFYTFRGDFYRNYKGDVASALPDFNKSIELDPNKGEVYYFRAICYYFTKDYNKAWDDVNKAKSLGYEVPSFFINDLTNASSQSKLIF
jgi:tetratricopeptide (TPR) repeat protein